MKTNRIDAAATTYQDVTTDALALRLRRTAMAGAAALALTGGMAAPIAAAAEVVEEVNVEEKKRSRFADVARRFVTPDFIDSRKNRETAHRLLEEQRAQVAQAHRDVTTLETRVDAASEGLAEVEKGLTWYERRIKSPQRLFDAQNEKSEAGSALTSAQERLVDETGAKKERSVDAVKATLRGHWLTRSKRRLRESEPKRLKS